MVEVEVGWTVVVAVEKILAPPMPRTGSMGSPMKEVVWLVPAPQCPRTGAVGALMVEAVWALVHCG